MSSTTTSGPGREDATATRSAALGVRHHDSVPVQHAPRLAASWREHLAIRLIELEDRAAQVTDDDTRRLILQLLHRARGAVEGHPTVGAAWSGADVERAWASTHAAEVALVRVAPLEDVTATLPSLVADCALLLPGDARVTTLRKIADSGRPVTEAERTLAADTLQSAHQTSDAQHARVRTFRNLLLGTTGVLTIFAILIAVVAAFAPGAFAVCETLAGSKPTACPTGALHPTGGDVFVIEVIGLFAAAITGAFAIRKLSGTSTPYAVPLASLALKLPTGALTALGGLMLLRAGFGPNLSSLNQAQVSAWALIFGASQQLFMQFVDRQAQTLLADTVTPGDKSTGKRAT